MALFDRFRGADVPRIDVHGEEATLHPPADAAAPNEAAQPFPEADFGAPDPRRLKLPTTKWY